MMARSFKWQYKYEIACDIHNWDLPADDIDRIRFGKWCWFYKNLKENYDEDERPDERMIHYDVLVDDFIKRENDKRKRERNKNKKPEQSVDKGNMSFG